MAEASSPLEGRHGTDPTRLQEGSRATGPEAWSLPRHVSVRLLVLIALLLAEVWLLRRTYTTDTLIGSTEWWAPLVRFTRFNVPWGLCILGGILVLGGTRLRARFGELVGESDPRRGLPQVLAHAFALAAFFVLTGRVLDPERTRGLLSLPWVLSWLVSAGLLLYTLLWIAFPSSALRRFFARTWWAFAGGVVGGSAAFGVGAYLSETWPFWRALSFGTLWVSNAILGLFVDERIYVPEKQLFGTPEFPVIVTKYCSGYEGLSLFFVFFGAFLVLWRNRLRFPNALLLLPIGMVTVWLMNSVRIAALILVGTHVSPEVAIDGFHLNAGWPLICLVSFSFVALSTRSAFFSSRPVESRADTINPTAVYLAPLLVIIGTTMVAGAFTATPQSLYPLRVLAGATVLWVYRDELRSLERSWSWAAAGLGAIAFFVWAGLHPMVAEEHPLAWQESRSLVFLVPWWILKTLGTVLVVPVAEELAFRGYLIRRLIGSEFERISGRGVGWIPIAVSSVAFGVLHHAWLAGTVVGFAYGTAYRRRGRVLDAALAHGVTNLLLLGLAALTGDWVLVF